MLWARILQNFTEFPFRSNYRCCDKHGLVGTVVTDKQDYNLIIMQQNSTHMKINMSGEFGFENVSFDEQTGRGL